MGRFWAILVVSGLSAMGCGSEEPGRQPAAQQRGAGLSGAARAEAEPVPQLSVARVAALLGAHEAVAFDANSDATRRQEGIVPHARLLTSSGSYDPATELPPDHAAKLVFYCANERCNASEGAAARARDAGWSDVNVMRAGITGWKAEGQPTAPMPQG